MSLKARIQEDIKTAMRAHERERLAVLRLVSAAIKQKEVDERIELDDTQVLAVLDKMVKQRRESLEQYEKAGREDLAATERYELDLIQESVGNASARIRFFRIAFGAAGEQMMGRSETVDILKGVMHGARLHVAWGPMDAQTRGDVRLAFLALLCVESAMPYGGRIEVSETEGRWLLHGHAEKLNIDQKIWSILATQEPPSDLRPAQVQFALLPLIATDMGRRVVTELSDTEIKLSF